MQRVRKGKGYLVFDESKLLSSRDVRGGLKSPGGFEGFEQRCRGGCDSLTKADGVSSRGGAHHEGQDSLLPNHTECR